MSKKAKKTNAELQREKVLAEIPRDEHGEVMLPITVTQAAALWGKSSTRVKLLIAQGRVHHRRLGSGGRDLLLIEQRDPPPDLARGELTPEQRAVKGRKRSHG